MVDRASLYRYAVISILAALATIVLKGGAYVITGSVGLLSDALESLVNLAAAIVALIALSAAARPEDEDHRYGHSKAEYFSSGFEGALILLAAASIIYASVRRLLAPQPIEQIAVGAGIAIAASLINLFVARKLFRAGRAYQSITLEADAHHLMSDVWTSAGVVVGVAAAAMTGWQRLDPVIAILVALNILRTGGEHPPSLAHGIARYGHSRGAAAQDHRDPRAARERRRALPRPADATGGRVALHRLPRAGAGELVGAARARSARADRGGSARGRAQQ